MSIHQEAVIPANPEQIYRVLTNGELFAAATEQPAQVGDREGETFSLFSGRIEGRQIELVPGERVVQAWRFGRAHPDEWAPGVYSVVRFTFRPEDGATRFVVDHEAVPQEYEEHVRGGYPMFYAGPLARYFAA